MLTPEQEREAYEDLSLDQLEELARQQLAEKFPDADPNEERSRGGRNTENQGALGRFDGLISANFRRPDSLDQGGEVEESEAPNAAFWTSSAIPPKRKR